VSVAALAALAGPCLVVVALMLLPGGVPLMTGIQQRMRWMSGDQRASRPTALV